LVGALRTFLFWSYSATVPGAVIAFGTDGPFSHMGIGFDLSIKERVYYEALLRDGFHGPRRVEVLCRYIQEKPKRKLVIEYTDFNAETSERKRRQCETMVGQAGYHAVQLVLMALSERYWIPVPRSPSRVVCSEGVSRIVCPELDLRDARRKRHDMVNPNSAWRRFLEIKCGHGSITAPPQ